MKYRCHFVVSPVYSLKKNDQVMFRHYLLPFSSECCMYSSVKLTLFVSFCVGVKFGVLHQEKNTDWGFVRAEYLVWEGGRNREMQNIV